MLIGNIGADPDIKSLQDCTLVAKFALATTDLYRLKNGESKSSTIWHTIIVWRGLATFASQFLHKGSHIYIEGKINYRQYPDKEGLTKHVTEIVADQIILLDKKSKQLSFHSLEDNNQTLPF